MNRIEQSIHNVLEDYPSIRIAIRDFYQRVCGVIPVKDVTPKSLIVRPGYFFGFHNICPWSPDNRLLLTHKFLKAPLHKPLRGEAVGIGYFSGDKFDQYTQIAETDAWNWQQGSMLQWLGETSHLIFNYFDGDEIHASIRSVDGVQVGDLAKPIAAVSPDGAFAASVSFERLKYGMPGYEYASCGSYGDIDNDIPKHDGMYIIDNRSKKFDMIFSIEHIANMATRESFKDSYHFFSHCLFSPNSKRLLFFHRWLQNNKALKTRMISCDPDGRNIYFFPTNDFVSHICWLDDDHVIAFSGTSELGKHYFLFPAKGGKPSIVGKNYFTSDGHPNISPDKRWLLTDTYPDRFRMQHLILYDLQNDMPYCLLKLRIPFQYKNQLRCDYHPRWDRLGQNISFDSAHSGLRAHCTVAIDT